MYNRIKIQRWRLALHHNTFLGCMLTGQKKKVVKKKTNSKLHVCLLLNYSILCFRQNKSSGRTDCTPTTQYSWRKSCLSPHYCQTLKLASARIYSKRIQVNAPPVFLLRVTTPACLWRYPAAQMKTGRNFLQWTSSKEWTLWYDSPRRQLFKDATSGRNGKKLLNYFTVACTAFAHHNVGIM